MHTLQNFTWCTCWPNMYINVNWDFEGFEVLDFADWPWFKFFDGFGMILFSLNVVRVISYYLTNKQTGYQNVSYIYLYRSFNKNSVTNIIAVGNLQSWACPDQHSSFNIISWYSLLFLFRWNEKAEDNYHPSSHWLIRSINIKSG